MRVQEFIDIARPAEDVWDFVADPSNDVRWCRKVKAVDAIGQRRWNVLHKPVPLRPPTDLALEQLDLERPQRLTMREEDKASIFRVEYRLEPSPSGTHFTQISECEWKKLPRFLHSTFERGVRRDIRNQLQALKDSWRAPDGRDGRTAGRRSAVVERFSIVCGYGLIPRI